MQICIANGIRLDAPTNLSKPFQFNQQICYKLKMSHGFLGQIRTEPSLRASPYGLFFFFHMSKMTSLFHLYKVTSIQQNIQPNVRRYLWWIILIQQMMRYFCCVYSSFLIKSTSKFDGSLLHVANYKGFITQYPILLHSINGYLF